MSGGNELGIGYWEMGNGKWEARLGFSCFLR